MATTASVIRTASGATTSTSLSTSTGPSLIPFFQRDSVFSPGRVQTTFHCDARSAALPLFDGFPVHFGFSGGLGAPGLSSMGFSPAEFESTASRRGKSLSGRPSIVARTPAR